MIDLPKTISTPRGLSVEVASPALLEELLALFDTTLRAHGLPMDEGLAPGLDAAEIRAAFATIGLTAPDEIVTWFEWQNGAVPIPGRGIWLLPQKEAWSVDTVLEMYPGFPRGAEVWEWDRRWVKLCGEKYGLAVWFDEDPTVSPIVRDEGWGETMPLADLPSQVVSLCTPIAWWIEAIVSGRYVWDSETSVWDYGKPDYANDPRAKTNLF